jgi:hypothetical protein
MSPLSSSAVKSDVHLISTAGGFAFGAQFARQPGVQPLAGGQALLCRVQSEAEPPLNLFDTRQGSPIACGARVRPLDDHGVVSSCRQIEKEEAVTRHETVSPEQKKRESQLTERVLPSSDATPDPRLKELTQALTRHLHSFLQESKPLLGGCPHAIPDSVRGPVGRLLTLTGRSSMRASHLHLMVKAEGLRTFVTHIFVRGDELLDRDSVFGVRDSLVMDFESQPAGKACKGSPPRRRTVLTVPEMGWITGVLGHWISEIRPVFGPGALSALWGTERASRISVRAIDHAFTGASRAVMRHAFRKACCTPSAFGRFSEARVMGVRS